METAKKKDYLHSLFNHENKQTLIKRNYMFLIANLICVEKLSDVQSKNIMGQVRVRLIQAKI